MPHVLTDERRAEILARLQASGRVLAADLAADFGCSVDTIRRDLRDLDTAGQLRRVHGGALPRAGVAGPLAERTRRANAAKASIAQRAARLARDGQVIVVDGGTTALEVARALPDDLRATVLTTSPPVAVALADHPGLTVTTIGGTLLPGSLCAVGADAVQALAAINADLVFLGICGLHPEIGLTADDPEERHVKAAMIAGAAEVVALADGDKLGTRMPFVVGPITAVTHLVTDADDATAAPYRAAGLEVVRAP